MDKARKLFKNTYTQTDLGKLLFEKCKEDFSCLMKIAGDLVIGSKAYGSAMEKFILRTTELSDEDRFEADRLLQLEIEEKEAINTFIKVSTASTSAAKFEKRFIYFLAIAVFSFSALIVLILLFKEIPDSNRDVVNFILGVIIGTGLTGIFNYFFGSSQGSVIKGEELSEIKKELNQ